jgi:hypothetical protein
MPGTHAAVPQSLHPDGLLIQAADQLHLTALSSSVFNLA